MFGRSAQQKQIETLQRTVRDLEGLVDHLAERAGVDEDELERLRARSAPRLPEEARRLVAEGRTIEAIKRHRELTGSSLREAKAAIDAAQGRG